MPQYFSRYLCNAGNEQIDYPAFPGGTLIPGQTDNGNNETD